MRVIVGCERSGRVRSAFRALGHDAWSCDLVPADDGSPHHIQGDVLRHLNDGWDLGIFHPPCTYLCLSGVRWLYKGGRKVNGTDPARWIAMMEGAVFFRQLLEAPIDLLGIENPEMHPYGLALVGAPTQRGVQPWQHGHGDTKAHDFWLKGLPPLEPTDVVSGRVARVHHESPGADRGIRRSETYPGIAAAMASQWGRLLAQAAA